MKPPDIFWAWLIGIIAVLIVIGSFNHDVNSHLDRIEQRLSPSSSPTPVVPSSDHACLPPLCRVLVPPTPRATPSAASRSRRLITIGLPITLQKIRTCESGDLHSLSSYNYRMQDPTSTASGAFGFLRSTWDNWGGYSQAKFAPPSVQDAKALATYRIAGLRPWAASRHCWSRL